MENNKELEKTEHEILKAVGKSWWLVLLRGILMIILGVLMLTNASGTFILFTIFLGTYWLVDGVFTLVSSVIEGKHNKHLLWSIIGGIISAVAGAVVILSPVLSSLIAATFLSTIAGIFILVSGIMVIFTAFKLWKLSGAWALLFGGVLWIITGILFLMFPVLSVILVVYLVGSFTIVGGITLVIFSFKIRKLK